MEPYRGPVIDAHHHLWDLSMGQHRWLTGPGHGALAALAPVAQDYGVADYRREAAREGIVASVHVEALWSDDPVDETHWLDRLDKQDGVALRYVANARLGSPQADRLIAVQAANPRVVAVRGILSHHPDPAKRFVNDPDLAANPAWRRDVARLRDHRLHLELMLYPHQAADVAGLARAVPDLPIVINHCASPVDRDPEGLARWHAGLRTLAAEPNILLKVSNPGAYAPDGIRDTVRRCLDAFGPDRAFFGSDAPVQRLFGPFAALWAALREAVADLAPSDQRKLFFDNARRLYRLEGEETVRSATGGRAPAL